MALRRKEGMDSDAQMEKSTFVGAASDHPVSGEMQVYKGSSLRNSLRLLLSMK